MASTDAIFLVGDIALGRSLALSAWCRQQDGSSLAYTPGASFCCQDTTSGVLNSGRCPTIFQQTCFGGIVSTLVVIFLWI